MRTVMRRVIDKLTPFAGGRLQAEAWYDGRILPGYGMTPKQLVEAGLVHAIDEFVEDLKNGVYA